MRGLPCLENALRARLQTPRETCKASIGRSYKWPTISLLLKAMHKETGNKETSPERQVAGDNGPEEHVEHDLPPQCAEHVGTTSIAKANAKRRGGRH